MIGYIIIFLSLGVFAMKPAPFENVEVKKDSLTFVSKREPDITEIKASGKTLWTMPTFSGRQHPDLSPDGKLLGLSGNYYWGMSHLKSSENPIVTTIFDQGKEIKKISITDIFAKDMTTLVKELKIQEEGGGWVPGRDLITKISFDWKTRSVTYSLYNKTEKKISF